VDSSVYTQYHKNNDLQLEWERITIAPQKNKDNYKNETYRERTIYRVDQT